MKKILYIIFACSLLVVSFQTKAQTYADGAMDLQMWVTYSWVENYDDPVGADEYNFIWYGADNADIDGQGWRPNTPNQSTSGTGPFPKPNQIAVDFAGAGWVTGANRQLFAHSYTGATVPQFLQLYGEKWEDDCFDCSSSGSLCLGGGCGLGSADRYRYNANCCTELCAGCSNDDIYCVGTVNTAINYRLTPPCSAIDNATPSTGWVGDYFSTFCGSNDMGAEVSVYYTPPIPSSFTAVPNTFCAGGGTVTLNLAGAVYGGTYDIFDESTGSFIITGTAGPTYVLNVPSTRTFRLYTRNGTCRSISYRTVTVTIAPAVSGGTIAANQTICYNTAPAGLTNSAPGSGGTGGFTYQWESQANCTGGFGPIGGATGLTYNPPALTQTTCYRRVATNTCGSANSNTVTITVLPQLNFGTVSGGGGTFCATADPSNMTVNPSGGTGTFNYQWYFQNGNVACPSGTSTVGWTSIGGATSSAYDPPAGLTTTRTYAVQVDPAGSPDCGSATWASGCVVVTVNPAATANAGGPNTLCQTNSPAALTLSGASVGGSATTGAWQILSGGGTLSTTAQTASPATVTYTPSAGFSGTVTLQLTTNDPDGAGPCTAVSANRTITINPGATVSAGSSITICEQSSPSPIALSGASFGGTASTAAWSIISGGGSLSSNAQTASPASVTYTPAAGFFGTVTLRLTTNDPDGAGPCTAEFADRTININQAATANAGTNLTACQSATPGAITLSGAAIGGSASTGVWSIVAGGGSLSSTTPTATPALVSYTPTANFSGVVTLQLTTNDPDGAGPCTEAISSRTIIVNQAATATAGGPNTLCESASPSALTLSGASIGGAASIAAWSIVSGGGALSTTAPVANPAIVTYTPASGFSGTVTLQLTTNDPDGAGPCASAIATRTITINPAATANAGGTLTACESSSPTAIALTGASIGGAASTGVWSIVTGGGSLSSNTPTATPSTVTYTPAANFSGTAVLQLTTDDPDGAGPCVAVSATRNIVINPTATVNAGNNLFVCESASPAALTLGGAFFGGAASTAAWAILSGGGTLSSTAQTNNPANVTYTPAANFNGTVILELTTNDPDGAGPCAAVSTTRTITVHPLPSAAPFSNSPVCINNPINLNANASGGTTPYTYNWAGPNGFNNINGTPSIASAVPASVGTYNVTVTDNNLCSVSASTAVVVNSLPNGSISGSVTVCAGVDTVLTFNFSSGASPFDVSYTDGTNVFTKTGVVDGDTVRVLATNTTTYSLSQIIDANGCERNSLFGGSATITISPLPVISNAVSSPVLCNGGNTGSITLTGANGVSPYQFSINGGSSFQPSNMFSGLTAGFYNAVISDALNCSSTYAFNPIEVTEPTVLDHSYTTTSASCSNVFDGSISVNAFGGVAPYTYSLNGGPTQPGSTFNGLAGGSYTLMVTDFNGCTDTSQILINNSYAVTASIVNQNDVSCFGGVDGSVTVQLSGGIPPYAYSINGVQFVPSPTFTGLSGGNYLITLRDSKGCTDYLNVTIAQPNLLQALIDSVDNILCSGGTTGGIYITVVGGTAPYNFLWSNGATTEDVTGIVTGTYNVAVTDAKGCSTSAGATIAQPLPLFVTVASFQNLQCFGDSSGAIDVTVNGGVPPYSFNWSNGASFEDIYGLQIGSYQVTVTDANFCTATLQQSINQPALLSSTISATPVLCAGGPGGSVTLGVTGGTPNYSYLWSNGAITQNLPNVQGGFYSVVVYDANGCSITNSTIVTEPTTIALTISGTQVLCNGASTGAVNLSVSGGTPTYTFAWSNGATTEDLNGLSAGVYSVTVTDLNLCTATTSVAINQPAGLVLNATTQNVGCAGGANGFVDITVQGGVFPYNFNWSNGVTTEDVYGLSGGTYSLTITDANNCSLTATYTLTEPTAITSTISAGNITCFGGNDGSVTLGVSGGVTPYTFLWNTFQSVQNLSNVSAGQYFVIIKDANNCEHRDSIIVTQPAALVLSVSVTNSVCYGSNTGSIDLNVSGGTPNYTYNWSTGATLQDLNGISGGNFTVTVTDANLCTATVAASVSQPQPITFNATAQNVSCAGGGNGFIDVTVFGGNPPYQYDWSNGSMNEDIYGLSGGTYTLTITDANLCSASASFNIIEPAPITSSTTVTNVTCNGAANGSIDLTVTGGNVPYSFLWSNFTGSEDVTGLSGGLYYVVITDGNSCTHKDSAFVTEPTALTLSTGISNVSCYNSNDGAIDLTVTGGTPNYTYTWSNGATTEDISSLGNGTYVVTVVDANNCSATTSVTIINPSVITTNFVVKNPSCFGDANGQIDLIPSGGTPPFSFAWSNGASTEDVFNLSGGTFLVTLTDSKGCARIDSATTVEPLPLVTSGFITHVSCYGNGNGFIDITAYGGTLPYAFEWSNGPSTEDVGSVSGGNYFVTVTDANNCVVAALYVVLEPQPLAVSMSGTNATCFGSATGTVSATVNGGTTPYYYLWNNFETTSAIAGVPAGKYTVQVIDSNGCFLYDTVTITEPTALQVSGLGTDIVCHADTTGSIVLTVSGGTPGYSFVWSNGPTTQNNINITAGQYDVTVTDTLGCQKTAQFTLLQGPKINVGVSTFHPICHNGYTGAVTAIVGGGEAPYAYNWNTPTPQTTISVGALPGGTYTVTVTDNKGCTATADGTLNNPAPIVVSANASGAKCFNTTDGKVTAVVNGGTAPYNYFLNGIVQTTDTFYNLPKGSYVILVSDVNGCQGNTSFNVVAPSDISVSLGVTQQVILSGMNTTLVATPNSATPIISYWWSPDTVLNFDGCANPQLCNNPLAAPKTTTTFTVYAMNADSCVVSDTVTVTVLNQPSQFIPTAFTPNGDGLNDRFEFDILGAKRIEMAIFNRWGERVYYNADQQNGITGSNGWDGTIDGKRAPFDTYVYRMVITYFDSIEKTVEGTVAIMN